MRNRISYQNVGLMVGPAPAYSSHSGISNMPNAPLGSSKLRTLNLVQNTSFNFDIAREEISQVGGFNMTARKVTSQPSVSLGFSYILSEGKNEDMLGFCISGQNSAFLSGTHEKNKDRNFFLAITDKQEEEFILNNQRQDFTDIDILSFGNCFPVAYSLEASVGSIAMANLEYSASNVKAEKPNQAYGKLGPDSTIYYAVTGVIPAINPENGQVATSVATHGYLIHSGHINDNPIGGILNTGDIHYLRPGDMELTFAQPSLPGALISGSSPEKMHINQLSINIPISRTDSKGFGSNYITERKAQFPSVGSLNFSATANNFNQENLSNIFTKDEEYTFTITFKDPTEGVSPTNKAIELEISKARCQSQSFSEDIGANMKVDASFNFECTPFTGFKFSGVASLEDSAATWS
jgi:hypothetical protein